LGCFDLIDGMKRLSLPVVKGAISDGVGKILQPTPVNWLFSIYR